jgi:molybdate transport system ATP-binding protein
LLSVDIKKRLGDFKLDARFDAGEGTLALLGASGCGKSLTLRCIAGIETPDEGRITLNNRVLFDSALKIDLPPQKRRVGYLFQQYSLFPNMTVARNIAAGVRTRDRRAKRAAVASWVAAMRLGGFERRRPAELSGGQRQRVALARCLAGEPEALLLDEPFSALDDYLKWQLELELSDTLKNFGGTAVYVSHSRDEVYRLCSRVCVLDNGRGEGAKPVRQLFVAPQTLAACLISGCKNISRARCRDGGFVEAADWGVTLRVDGDIPDGTAYVGVRAHYVRPVAEPGENAVLCRAERVVDDVFSTVVMLSTPGGGTGYSLLRMDISKDEWRALGEPEQLYVQITPGDIMLLREN